MTFACFSNANFKNALKKYSDHILGNNPNSHIYEGMDRLWLIHRDKDGSDDETHHYFKMALSLFLWIFDIERVNLVLRGLKVDEIDTNPLKDVLFLISSYRIHLITTEQKEAFFNAEIEIRRMERKIYHVTDALDNLNPDIRLLVLGIDSAYGVEDNVISDIDDLEYEYLSSKPNARKFIQSVGEILDKAEKENSDSFVRVASF